MLSSEERLGQADTLVIKKGQKPNLIVIDQVKINPRVNISSFHTF